MCMHHSMNMRRPFATRHCASNVSQFLLQRAAKSNCTGHLARSRSVRYDAVLPSTHVCWPIRGAHRITISPRFRGSPSRKPSAVRCSTTSTSPVVHYRYLTKQGTTVAAAVKNTNDDVTVEVAYTGNGKGSPQLHWGVFRSSITKWHHPQDMQPPGSIAHQPTGAMRTPMTWDGETKSWLLSFTVGRKLMPLHLGIVVYQPEGDRYEGPSRGLHFSVPLGMRAGQPAPFGAMVMAHEQSAAGPTFSLNFAVFSRHAATMSLCIARVKPPEAGDEPASVSGAFLEVALDPSVNRTGDSWHIQLEGLRDLETLCYAWRAEGNAADIKAGQFHPGFLLLDPHAPLALPVRLPEAVLKSAVRLAPNSQMASLAFMGCLAGLMDGFEWDDDPRPRLAAESTTVYELDVASFSEDGSFLGVIAGMDAIVATGATAVLINRLALTGQALGVSGQSPVSYFAPDPSFASGSPLLVTRQLKAMVQAMHHAGLEVLLEVDFCLTGEGTTEEPRMVSLRGLDPYVYYRSTSSHSVLNTGHPVVNRLVVEALRHWATEYHIDGFVFEAAENLVQDRDGTIQDAPAVAEEVVSDPVLRGLKMIASCSSSALLPRSGSRGFPHWGMWMEMNGRFRADAWAFVQAARHGMLSTIATRIAGSPDLFGGKWDEGLPGNLACERRSAFGVSSLMALGDESLTSAVAAADNGFSGPSYPAATVARSLMTLQWMSAGIPCVTHATAATSPDMAGFIAVLVAIRSQYNALLAPPLWDAPRDLLWHGITPGSTPDWAASYPAGSHTATFLAFSLRSGDGGQAIYVAFNPHPDGLSASLPPPPVASTWRLLLDSAASPPSDANVAGVRLLGPGDGSIWVGGRGAVVLDAVPSARAAAAMPW